MKLIKKRTACDECVALTGMMHMEYCSLGFRVKMRQTRFSGISIPYPAEPCAAPKTIKAYIALMNEKRKDQ